MQLHQMGRFTYSSGFKMTMVAFTCKTTSLILLQTTEEVVNERSERCHVLGAVQVAHVMYMMFLQCQTAPCQGTQLMSMVNTG